LAGAARICAADRACGQFPAEDCVAVVEPILRKLAPGAVECFEARLPACDFDVLQCFRPDPARNTVEACNQGCADRAACGQLFVLESEADCRAQCAAALTGAAPQDRDKFTQTAYCAGRATCAEFAECLTGAEARVLCNQACQGQANCLGRIDDIQGCIDDCRLHWNGERMQAFAACHFVGGDCAAVDRCYSVPDNDCAVLCEAFEGCAGGPAGCQAWCDGQRWMDPQWYPAMVACAWGAQACEDRLACLQDTAPANACVAWCTASGCQGGPTVFGECAHDCGRYGVGSYGGVAFRQIEGCLADLGADATCQVLQNQCPLPRLSDAYCPQLCAAVSACDGQAGQACAGECAQRWEAEPFINAASDVMRALGRGEGCPAVLAAWGER
ncbi:MAG: hypothetical protein KC613_07940, partial [Myxococcales bacterium]|nr:hypothetical protein [Myxococcales bacterium]